jgi:UDP-perosamine 4-acetyltransferase
VRIVLIGGGGHAAAVADAARSAGWEVAGILTPIPAPAPGLERLGDDGWIEAAPDGTEFHIAFGPAPGGCARVALFERLKACGRHTPIVAASTAEVRPGTEIGEGTAILHGAFINVGAAIGRNCIVNSRAIIEHDCTIGDHSHLAPGSIVGGGVRIGARCLVGLGAVVLPGLTIADGVTIGAGAVVVRSIEENDTTWSGNPAQRHG